jgi:hypothetical protein
MGHSKRFNLGLTKGKINTYDSFGHKKAPALARAYGEVWVI